MDIKSFPYRIPCYMFGHDCRLRPAAFFDIAQELAGMGVENEGVSDKDLESRNLVWILARMTVRYDKYPLRYDEALLQTWHRGLEGPFFIREYKMSEPGGGTFVRSTSSWILMDRTDRRIVRGDCLGDAIYRGQHTVSCMDCICRKIVPPASATVVGESSRRVSYSDVDYNGHVNNARYIMWSIDCLPDELAFGKSPCEISVNFNHEAVRGETVALSCLVDGNGRDYYVEGSSLGHQVFVCRIVFD